MYVHEVNRVALCTHSSFSSALSLISVYLLISFLHFFLHPTFAKYAHPSSIIHLFSILFTWWNSLLHQRAPTPRWPSAWRPMIECTTWWRRRLRPCVYGWMSWLQEQKDTCISWCSQSQKFIGLDFFWWTLCHLRWCTALCPYRLNCSTA